jgi:hypothetical protein
MDADFSVELGPDAPALELPWTDPKGHVEYIDLRDAPNGIERIPEARQFPALRKLLIDVNAPLTPWQTAKCDVWTETAEAADNLYGAAFMQSCYVDLVLAKQWKSLRANFELHEGMAREIARSLETKDSIAATVEIVVRRCYFHRETKPRKFRETGWDMNESDAGYCLTMYVSGFGNSGEGATAAWEQAIGLAGACLLQLQPLEERAKDRELS